MRLFRKIKFDSNFDILNPLVTTLKQFDNVILLNSNAKNSVHNIDFDYLIGLGSVDNLTIDIGNGNSFEQLRSFHLRNRDWMFGHLSYDLKNELENLESKNEDRVKFPLLSFFVPMVMLKIKHNFVKIYISDRQQQLAKNKAEDLIFHINDWIKKDKVIKYPSYPALQIHHRMSHSEYKESFKKIHHHIQRGDVYEMNFCQEFYTESIDLNPYTFYAKLNKISPTPYSVFYGLGNKFLISSSPERYIKKEGNRIISQPIKGTAPRYYHKEKDEKAKTNLAHNPKERAENIMIVDLVRNDLSRTAKPKSVKVEELCGIYSFPQVHQMISTISSVLGEEFDFIDLLKTTFPMGSMTGAPKIKAMELIEEYETTKRGIYSGAVGYITPEANFDFNVIIRSVMYDKDSKYLSFITGGAITSLSTAEQEYEECLLKAKGIIEAFR